MNKKSIFLIVPFLLLNSVVIIAALFKAIQVSFGYYPVVGMTTWTTEYFQQVLTSQYFQSSIFYSLYLAITATVFSIVLGLALAFIIMKSKSRWFQKILQIPIAMPHLIVTLMVMQMISQSGIISRIFFQIGVISDINQFPLLIHDQGGFGILLVFLYKEIPYVAVATLAILKQMQFGYLEVAKNLGASPRQAFFKVTLPLIQPTLATLFIILFCFVFASFEVPYLLGSPRHETIAVTAYQLFNQVDLTTRPQAFALNLIMSAICLLVSFLTLLVSRLLPGGHGGGLNEE
ncbi:ABC transporter permease [Enterococcus sp. AZ103]|uniref:ABC transporter permease n=1 Tax=Enterococcus sp. AZ103 TaxID=2774628 RepID=UPI003F24BACA